MNCFSLSNQIICQEYLKLKLEMVHIQSSGLASGQEKKNEFDLIL